MEPDTYITSHYGSSPFFERVGIAKELQCSIRAQSQVPTISHAQHQGPFAEYHKLSLETMTQQSTGHLTGGPKYSKN